MLVSLVWIILILTIFRAFSNIKKSIVLFFRPTRAHTHTTHRLEGRNASAFVFTYIISHVISQCSYKHCMYTPGSRMKFGGKLLNFPDSSGCDAYTYVTRIDENRFIVANKDVSSEIHGRVLKFGILSGPFVRCGGTRTGTWEGGTSCSYGQTPRTRQHERQRKRRPL